MGSCYDYVWWNGWIKLRDGNGKEGIGMGDTIMQFVRIDNAILLREINNDVSWCEVLVF